LRPIPLAAGLLSAAILGAAPALAQTTHTVTLQGTSFTPADVVIDVGDTVQWDWVSGMHNVVSGVNPNPDGHFRSGDVAGPPMSFSVTFDQAFLDAHPMSGNLYPYYCEPHGGAGMLGSVTVRESASATFRNDAGGTNLATYANVNPPVLGGSWDSTIDVSSHAGALGALIVGYGGPLEAPSPFGWILVDITHPGGQLVQVSGFGSGVVSFGVPVPSDAAFLGLEVATQGVVLGGGIELTNAQDLVLGT
jgi:plastocyanin